MSGSFQRPPGTRDWALADSARRRWVIDAARAVFELAGYSQVVTPTFEDTGVYARTSGETSDVVKKEMYTFTDRGGRSLTLRPEGTAGVMRAYIEDGMHRLPQPVRQYYVAPMFRYARVQRGRFREHYQFGVEAIGSDDPALDAEVIALQQRWYASVGAGPAELQLNSIGDGVCRPGYIELLTAYLDEHADELCADCRDRRHTNPLRTLDCKNPGCRAVLAAAPRITDHLCEPCAAHFAEVRAHLDARGVGYTLDHTLVRGLDYYTRTAWEFVTTELGAQGTIGGGGRYDGLSEQLGGPAAPGVGFGSGIERVLELAGERPPAGDDWVCFAVTERAARPRCYALVGELLAAGRAARPVLGDRSLRRMLEAAGRGGAAATVIVGPDEWARGAAIVRDMHTHAQRDVPLDRLVEELSSR